MNILVTGGNGFLGRHLASHLCANNHEVYFLIHDNHKGVVGTCPACVLYGDVTNYGRMLEVIVDCEIDQIYHCAAKSVVRNCRVDPLGCLRTNVLGTATVLEAARQSERVSGIMVMESDKAYGNGPVPYEESQRLAPKAVYEASKACVSHLVEAYWHNYILPVFGIRSANVYGPGDRQLSRLIPNTITRLLAGKAPQITEGAAHFVREWIYIDDFVHYALALMARKPWGRSVNVGTGETRSVAHVVGMLCGLFDWPLNIEEWTKPETLLEITEQALCLKQLHTWVPDHKTMPLHQGLVRTINWYRTRYES